ncbi:MAG: hypothetical protein JWM25_698 [Thermoleophilia bacterium]|nr:hypothetical protein [Thermoleophilia bacterium]MCZ4496115.1 hypothetical protein [Thermoleophilia bacterium]
MQKFITLPAAVAVGGVAAVGTSRAADSDRGAADRIVSGAVGVGSVVAATMIATRLGIKGAQITDDAMQGLRSLPRGTATVTRGNATWYITPQQAIGDAMSPVVTSAGSLGAIGGALVGHAGNQE